MEKDELDVNLLSFSGKYIELHGQVTGKPDYKASQKLKDYQKELKGDEDAKIKMYPSYRGYMLSTLGQDFQAYAMKTKSQMVLQLKCSLTISRIKRLFSIG